ncbi:MAG: mercuric transporter MerT family protein [Candidatus Berkiella sp.]
MKWGSNESLIVAIVAGFTASLCCIGPLLLLLMGIGGAWASVLTSFSPVQPIAIVVTIFFLGSAFWQLYIKPQPCAPDKSCKMRNKMHLQKIVFWVVTILVILLLITPWFAPLFY